MSFIQINIMFCSISKELIASKLPVPSVGQLELKAFCKHLKPDLIFSDLVLETIHGFLEKIIQKTTLISLAECTYVDISQTLSTIFPSILQKNGQYLLHEKSRNTVRVQVDELYKYLQKVFYGKQLSEPSCKNYDLEKRADDLAVILEFIIEEIVDGAFEAAYCDERECGQFSIYDIQRSIWGDEILKIDTCENSMSHFNGDNQLRELATTVGFNIIY